MPLTQRSRTSFLIWIPGNKGILGNEIVNFLINDTSKTSPSFPYILHSDVLEDIKIKTNIPWQKLYEQAINNKSIYYKIQPCLPSWLRYSQFSYIPHYPLIISHLRFNHIRLPANLAHFIPNLSPLCPLHPNTSERSKAPTKGEKKKWKTRNRLRI